MRLKAIRSDSVCRDVWAQRGLVVRDLRLELHEQHRELIVEIRKRALVHADARAVERSARQERGVLHLSSTGEPVVRAPRILPQSRRDGAKYLFFRTEQATSEHPLAVTGTFTPPPASPRTPTWAV
jgi:hypothetical protein